LDGMERKGRRCIYPARSWVESVPFPSLTTRNSRPHRARLLCCSASCRARSRSRASRLPPDLRVLRGRPAPLGGWRTERWGWGWDITKRNARLETYAGAGAGVGGCALPPVAGSSDTDLLVRAVLRLVLSRVSVLCPTYTYVHPPYPISFS
jgi:hypothetical protein